MHLEKSWWPSCPHASPPVLAEALRLRLPLTSPRKRGLSRWRYPRQHRTPAIASPRSRPPSPDLLRARTVTAGHFGALGPDAWHMYIRPKFPGPAVECMCSPWRDAKPTIRHVGCCSAPGGRNRLTSSSAGDHARSRASETVAAPPASRFRGAPWRPHPTSHATEHNPGGRTPIRVCISILREVKATLIPNRWGHRAPRTGGHRKMPEVEYFLDPRPGKDRGITVRWPRWVSRGLRRKLGRSSFWENAYPVG